MIYIEGIKTQRHHDIIITIIIITKESDTDDQIIFTFTGQFSRVNLSSSHTLPQSRGIERHLGPGCPGHSPLTLMMVTMTQVLHWARAVQASTPGTLDTSELRRGHQP